MNKEKANSTPKKAKKELEDKLITAFTTIVADYGKVKKSKAIIAKFAKLLSKKIDLKSKAEIVPAKEKVIKAKPVKKLLETAE